MSEVEKCMLAMEAKIKELQSKIVELEDIDHKKDLHWEKRFKTLEVENKELKAEKEGHVDHIDQLQTEVSQIQAENDKVMNEVYMRRKETKELRAITKALQSELEKAKEVVETKNIIIGYVNFVHLTIVLKNNSITTRANPCSIFNNTVSQQGFFNLSLRT